MNLNKLQEGLQTRQFGRRIVFMHEASSTNDAAKELAILGAAEGTVVVAETQTVGRGRLARQWVSSKGGLYFSIVLRPRLNSKEAVKLVFVAGLAVAKVLDEMYKLSVGTKWPNDVLARGRKICGILSESQLSGDSVGFVVVGVGINANISVEKDFPEALKRTATSMKGELGKAVALEELFIGLVEEMEKEYDLFMHDGFSGILNRWKRYAVFLGGEVEVACGSERWQGLALDVDGDGALVLECEDGTTRRVLVGDVSLRTRSPDP
jgi:BirA family biotin operon repressor/biotin-[acetyl-CoA-carboxylase] ligase